MVGGRGGAAQVSAIAPSCMPIALSLSVLGAGIAVGVAGAMFEVMLNVLYGSVCLGGGCSDGGRGVGMEWMPSTRGVHGRRGVRTVNIVYTLSTWRGHWRSVGSSLFFLHLVFLLAGMAF